MYRLRLLQKPGFCKFIRDQIGLFCETNCASSPNSFILWDTLKAFLSGHIISYTKGIKNKYMAKIEALKADILKLEKELQQSRSREVYLYLFITFKKLIYWLPLFICMYTPVFTLVNKMLRYNILHTYKIEKNILRSKQMYHGLGEKAHKILSWQLRKEESWLIQSKLKQVLHHITLQ